MHCESRQFRHSDAIMQGNNSKQLAPSSKVKIAIIFLTNCGRVVWSCREAGYHRLHDKWRWPRDAGSISFLMIGKSWFPDWNEYGKDLYPAVDSRSPLISCPWGAYWELFYEVQMIPPALLSFAWPAWRNVTQVVSFITIFH